MDLSACLAYTPYLLMEGALGERLKRENHIRIFGGCCGTDQRHMETLAKRLAAKNG